jgi:hypothetical protein
MSRFTGEVIKVPTELRKTQIDQAGESALSIGQLMGNETPLSTKQLKLLPCKGDDLIWLNVVFQIKCTHFADGAQDVGFVVFD